MLGDSFLLIVSFGGIKEYLGWVILRGVEKGLALAFPTLFCSVFFVNRWRKRVSERRFELCGVPDVRSFSRSSLISRSTAAVAVELLSKVNPNLFFLFLHSSVQQVLAESNIFGLTCRIKLSVSVDNTLFWFLLVTMRY